MVPLSRNAVETVALSKRYHERWAVDQVTLVVRQGEVFGLLGPNGAGKSTFVKMLLGLVQPTGGTARLLGSSYRDHRVRAQIGYLPELFRYQPWLTVNEVLVFHQRLVAPRSRQVLAIPEVLQKVGLTDRGRDRVKSLSKGLQQRLGLAVALVGNPSLLFLDEPTSAMDPLGRRDINHLIRQLKSEGKTICLNSHLLSDLEDLCDRVAVIQEGRVVGIGTLNEVLKPQSQYYFHTGRVSDETMGAMGEEGLRVDRAPGGLRIAAHHEQLPGVHRLLIRLEVDVYEVTPVKTSLEHWFLEQLQQEPEAVRQ